MDLNDIRPKTKERVIDLVNRAGVNVDDWSNWSGGAADAARNPRYCYEWSFVEPNKVVVLNLWFKTMRSEGEKIVYRLNSAELEAVEGTRNPSIWTARSRKIEAAIRSAHNQ